MSKEKVVCECGHSPAEHIRYKRQCRGMDSYGIPCECPSYVEIDLNEDNDETFDPLAEYRHEALTTGFTTINGITVDFRGGNESL